MNPTPYRLLEAIGIELEYMIVDRETLDVLPISDRLLHAVAGAVEMEVERGAIAWSNELVLHVIELKTNGPVTTLEGLDPLVQSELAVIDEILGPMGARLMPSAMHPWMDPFAEMRLWPHEDSPIYDAFDRIFDCRGHGWANLQSTHINLSFSDDEEFGRLHAAIRLVLPILPALAASSPVMDGRLTGVLDNRLEVYRHNAARVPQMSGVVIPEAAFSEADYGARILEPLYRALAPLDPKGTLQHEWANARGCIARFDRGSIEIRILDIQECPEADIAIAAAVIAVIGALCDETLCSWSEQKRWNEGRLAPIFLDCVRDADRAQIVDEEYLRLWGLGAPMAAGELWRALLARVPRERWAPWEAALQHILSAGCLARRLSDRLGTEPSRSDLKRVYGELCECLRAGRLFAAPAFVR